MIDDLELDEQRQKLIASLQKNGIHDERVLAVMSSTQRERFVDRSLREHAYADCALPLALGQTISQPLMVAAMTQALTLRGDERVLEIGTGSGYQTAILACLAHHVYSVERHQQLSYQAAVRLLQLGIYNVSLYVGDGSLGWPDAAPYDRILVTAASPAIPSLLFEQLVTWGMLVVPVGSQERQDLLVVHRAPWGPETYSLGSCVFVPLIGQEGWSE
ncbi:MAG TPA: protein-L-isoaspartate(D-aspartate) O-methyltransferase [Ktedonobacteraceae bacterium]|nr:protein-L-isoaspartate(D-aspartate) O-methyltransferase [Ktedonobacteraceae bacterium]